ncbi:MAG: TonB-dependent receptor [bacterium]|nr:TonB-dependent receptor [bacterium]
MKPFFVAIALLFFSLNSIEAQTNQNSFIKGKVVDKSNQPLPNTNIVYNLTNVIYHTDSAGNYIVPYIEGNKNTITFTHTGKVSRSFKIPYLKENEEYENNVTLIDSNYVIERVIFTNKRPEEPTGHIVFKPVVNGPGVSGDFMDGIKTLAGVASGNELSSQYNVRGGSYDENLIYVNDIEIYRPQLIRSGQQEGLSFINGDLVSAVSFSAGGFEAKYGDKLSSVLDVTYKTPKKTSGGFSGGLLGGSAYIEGIKTIDDKLRKGSKFTRFTYLVGARYRGNKNILNSADVVGSYKSRFSDFQSLFVYHLNRNNRIELLINLAQNRYKLEPELQQTTFGTLQNSLQLRIGFEGQEIMDYNSAMSGISFVHTTKTTELKFIASAFISQESEHYDVQGAYQISQVDNNLGSSSFGNATTLLGLGYFINHARNDLYFTVANLAHQGVKKILVNGKTTRLLWGIKYQSEVIHDRFKEWKYSDSSDYNMAYNSQFNKTLEISEYINSKTDIINHKSSGFVQYQKGFGEFNQVNFTLGTRYHYSSLNEQSLISPRAQLYFEPNRAFNARHRNDSVSKRKNTLLKFAFGYYYQPPFYREMRNFEGKINTNLKAQRSIHGVSGIEFGFNKWGRPFKLMIEGYYKQLDYLVPYLLDNVRIRYYATNTARGYATGIDSRLNGEFIKGIESWISLSVLKTDEKIMYVKNGNAIESPFLRRPTDRRVSASILFRDELNRNPDYRVNLMLNFGSGLPYYLGGDARYTQGNRLPTYRRVDIGFSKLLLGGKSIKQLAYAKKHEKDGQRFESLELGVDVYNLLQINNVISYIWVKDFQNNTYGVPNYLTGRRLNVKLIGKF